MKDYKEIDISKALSVTGIPIVTHYLSPEFPAIYIIPLSDEQMGDPGFYEELFLGYRKGILALLRIQPEFNNHRP